MLNRQVYSKDLPEFKFKETKALENFRTGLVYLNTYRYNAAKDYFLKSISIKEDFNLARKYLSDSYYLSGEWQEALDEIEILQAKEPSNPYHKNRAEVLRLMLGGHTRQKSRSFFKSISGDDFRGYRFKNPVDVLADKSGNIFLLSFETKNIIKFNSEGEPESNIKGGFGKSFEGPLYFTSKKDKIYVSDFAQDRIYILDSKGNFLERFGNKGREQGHFYGPSGIAVSEDGSIYISDNGNHRIQKFTASGKFLQEFGNSDAYRLKEPAGLAIEGDQLYVVNRTPPKIAIFDTEGNFQDEIYHKNLLKPRSLRFHKGRLYISDELSGVLIYNRQEHKWSKLSTYMDDTGKYRKIERNFALNFDSYGSMYLVDYAKHRLDIFMPINLLTSNIDLFIERIDLGSFPDVSLFLRIKNRTGKEITGMKRNQFRLFENDNPIALPGLTDLEKSKESLHSALIFENSEKINEAVSDKVNFLNTIFKGLTKNDKIEVIRAGSDTDTVYTAGNSILSAISKIRKSKPDGNINLGKAVFSGLTSMVKEVGPRSIILLVSGDPLENSFQQYSLNRLIQFASVHKILIHILIYNKKGAYWSGYKDLAEKTGGMLLTVPGSKKEKEFVQNLRNQDDKRYILSYKTRTGTSLPGKFMDLRLEVSYRNANGKTEGGYFVPTDQ